MNTVCVLGNRFIARSCKKDCTAYRDSYGSNPSLAQLKESGCKIFVHRPVKMRSNKFNPRSKPVVLVGCSRGDAYRVVMNDDLVLKSEMRV